MDDANALMDEARAMMYDAHQAKVSSYESKLQAVRDERRLSSKMQHDAKAKLERECRGYEAIINTMRRKHKKEMDSMENTIDKQVLNA